jgi:predicted CoA-binding protein
MVSRKSVDDFLGLKRIAVVGVSRNPHDFSRALFRDLRAYGYDVVPVHPEAAELDGMPCARRVGAIQPPVEGALLMTSPAVTEQVVKECAEAGVRRVWMYRAVGAGAVSEKALDFCGEHGIDVVHGYCPYMFLQQAGWYHKVHGFLLKLVGGYPR